MLRTVLAVFLVLTFAACGGKKASNDPPPPAPATGAPLAFVVDKIESKGLDVRAYNFSDKKIGQYAILLRYYDKAGAVVTVKPGTPFEDSFDTWSFSGRSFICEPKSWCSFSLDHLEIPAGAVKAEILASSLRALKDDTTFEDKDLFELPEHRWPGSENEPARWPEPFTAWMDPAKAKAAWQGAWSGDGFGLGDTAAWLVEGDKITFVNRKGEKHYTLTIDSPCTAGYSGGDGGWVNVYMIKDGQLITGLGDAGQKNGNKALVCGGGDTWLFDGTTCTRWQNHLKRWESGPGKCGFKQDAGKDIFFYVSSGDYESKLLIDGDTIWSEQLARDHAQKHPDLAAAKAAQKL